MQIQRNATTLLFGDLQQFILEAFSLNHSRLELRIGGFEIGGALLHARLQFVMRPPQGFLRAASLNELTDFAADRGHHIQQHRVWWKAAAGEKFNHTKKLSAV